MKDDSFDPSKAEIGVHTYAHLPSDFVHHLPRNVQSDPTFVMPKKAFKEEEEESTQHNFLQQKEIETPKQEKTSRIKYTKPDNKALIQQRLERLRSKEDTPLGSQKLMETEELGIDKVAFVHSILDDDEANPISIMVFLNEKWGYDWIDWEPETILQTAVSDNLNISRVNQDKVMAIKVLLRNPTDFFSDSRIFEKVCIAFSSSLVDWAYTQNVRIHDMASTVALVTRYIHDLPFDDDVLAYMGASAIRDGFLLLPEHLKVAEFEFSRALVRNIGDEAIEKQESLLKKIKEGDTKTLDSDEGIQLIRMVRVQQHVSEKLNEVGQ